MLGTLNELEIDELLRTNFTGRIGYTSDDKVYITPVTYAFNGTYIFGQTNEGMKLDYMRREKHVCFEVDEIKTISNWKSVITWGRFEELFGTAAEDARKFYYNSLLGLLTVAREHELSGTETESADANRIKSVMYRISISEQTGHFERR